MILDSDDFSKVQSLSASQECCFDAEDIAQLLKESNISSFSGDLESQYDKTFLNKTYHVSPKQEQ